MFQQCYERMGSQRKLARYLKVSQPTIHKILSGKKMPGPNILARLGCTPFTGYQYFPNKNRLIWYKRREPKGYQVGE